MGSWVVDFLLFNRAHAHYSGDDLTRFLAGYTAVLNLADILFLALLAGPLLRRFGLRLGLVLNPAVVAALLGAMAVIVAGPGAAAFSLFVLASVTRVSDIVLTDGTTRTSVNASFQVVPIEDRLAVQAVVEGIGVPVAIGATGAVLLVMNVLGLGIGAVIVFGVVLSVIWTASGVAMYRSYKGALADEMRRRPPDAYDVAEDDVALQALLRSDDARDVRLALDLLPGVVSPASGRRAAAASEHADPEVRMRALVQLAAGGDAEAVAEAAALADDLARSADPAGRRAAASALGRRGIVTAREAMLIGLLDDPDPTVRAAALDAVLPEDAGEPQVLGRVVAALDQPLIAGRATAALRRLGDAAVPLLAAALARDGAPRRAPLIRAAAAAAAEHGAAVIEPALATATASSCSPRSTRWMRPTPPASSRKTSSTPCLPTRPPMHPARSMPASRSPHPTGRCAGRWRTRPTSHGGSWSRCSRCATAIACGMPFGSWTARTASAAPSASRRST